MADRNAEETADIKKFFVEFGKESDRAAVILGAAKLDILLYQILQRYFIAETGSSDELLDGDHPLGTFSAKIKIAYRLGLIDRDITKSLNLIRRIRNSFAHELSGISLDNGGHRDRVKELVAPFHPYPDYQEFLDAFFGGKGRPIYRV